MSQPTLPPNAIHLVSLAQTATTSAFETYAEAVVAGTYCRTGKTPAAVSMLVMPVPRAHVDGTTVLPGDELVFIEATALAAIDQPRKDDYLVETTGSLRRNIVVAQLYPGGTVWAFIARKVFS